MSTSQWKEYITDGFVVRRLASPSEVGIRLSRGEAQCVGNLTGAWLADSRKKHGRNPLLDLGRLYMPYCQL